MQQRKLLAVSELASMCARNHLPARDVIGRMKAPEAYDFSSDRGLLAFALDAGSAVQAAMAARRVA